MIKIILSGHGKFSSGLYSALKLLSSDISNISILDFIEGDSYDELVEKMQYVINEDINSEYIILTDFPGGSPFKAAALTKINNSKVEVITGINFPLLMEIALSKDNYESAKSLVNDSISNAKEAMYILEL